MSAQVTVIVPVYKVENYLRRCLDSLLKQDCPDLQILVVNDGSPDGCGDIIREYVEANREKMAGIEKKNGGWGSAIQLGIRECRTPYFLVCDGDDTLEPDCISTLLNLAKVSGADLTCGARMVLRKGSPDKTYDCGYNKDYVSLKSNTVYNKGTAAFDDLFYLNPAPHAKLYRKEIAENIRFTERVGYCDNMLFFLSLLQARKVIYTDKPLADYLIDREGNSMTDVSYAAMNAQILVFKNLVNQAERLPEVPDFFWYRMFESYKYLLYESRNMKGTREEYESILNYLGTFVQKISRHGQAVMKYYRSRSKSAFLEQISDRFLLNPARFEKAYARIVRKMSEAFQPSQKAD